MLINFIFLVFCMGATIFYIPDDLMNELRMVGNRSALITSLLREYFNRGKPLVQIKEEKVKQTLLLSKEVEELSKEIEQEEKEIRKTNEEHNKLLNSEREEKEKEIKERRRAGVEEIFIKNWDINKEDINPLLEEFIKLFDSGQITNLIEFMELRQIKRKVKRV